MYQKPGVYIKTDSFATSLMKKVVRHLKKWYRISTTVPVDVVTRESYIVSQIQLHGGYNIRIDFDPSTMELTADYDMDEWIPVDSEPELYE